MLQLKFSKLHVRSMLSLVSSNLSSALIISLGILVITRLVSPGDFGLYAYSSQLALTIYPLLTLRYEHALPLMGRRRSARESILLATLAMSTTGFLMLLALSTVATPLLVSRFGADPALTGLAPLIVIAAFSFSVASIYQSALLAQGTVFRIALAKALRALALVSLQIAFVLLISASVIWLLIAELSANFIQAALVGGGLMTISILPRVIKYPLRWLRRVLVLLRQHKVFPLITLPHMMTHAALTLMLATAIGIYFGADELGQYYLMRKLVFGFLAVFGTAAAQQAISEASQLPRTEVYYVALRTLLVVCGVAVPGALVLGLFGPFIFTLVAGSDWTAAGHMAVASVPVILAEPVTAAFAFVAVFLGYQRIAFAVAVVQGVAGIAAITWAGYMGWDVISAVFFSSLAMAAIMSSYVAWLLHEARRVHKGRRI